MEISVVGTRGRVVVPAEVRRRLGIRKGTRIAYMEQNGRLLLLPIRKGYFRRLAGILGTKGIVLKDLMREKRRERKL
jgi:AbrB family looped-hinge helix DNA binding protein